MGRIYGQYVGFISLVILITYGIIAAFLLRAAWPATGLAALYWVTVFAYYGLIVWLVGLLVSPLLWVRPLRWIPPVLAGGWLFYLILDYIIFGMSFPHINRLMIDIFMHDYKGLGLPPAVPVAFGVAIVVLVALSFFLMWLARHRRFYLARGVAILVLPMMLVNYVIGVWGIEYNRPEITRYAPYLPMFYPITDENLAQQLVTDYPNVFSSERGKEEQIQMVGGGSLDYPKNLLNCSASSRDNILILATDSWQKDTISSELTPNIWAFAQGARRYDSHQSSGSATTTGIFGMFSGVHATYYDAFVANPISGQSVLTKALRDQGYAMQVITSDDLTRFSLKTLLWPDLSAEEYRYVSSDAQGVDLLIGRLNDPARSKEGNFDFLFLNSTHATYNYPPEFAKFTPLPTVETGYALDKFTDAAPYKNDYYNSVGYVDHLFGQIIDTLRARDILANTWVIITGDHAEEFNEGGQGHWGHGTNFSRWQTNVPFILHAPNRAAGIFRKMSLHQDIVPTLMTHVLGCTNPVSDYSNGADLLNLPDRTDTVFSSYFDRAYLIDGNIYEVLTGRKYKFDNVGAEAAPLSAGRYRDLVDQETQFLREP